MCRRFSYGNYTFGKTERGSVGVLESHPPTQARTTARHPSPNEKETQGVPGRAATRPAPEMLTSRFDRSRHFFSPLFCFGIALLTVQLVPPSGEVNAWEFATRVITDHLTQCHLLGP
jgi:hypothetical protein